MAGTSSVATPGTPGDNSRALDVQEQRLVAPSWTLIVPGKPKAWQRARTGIHGQHFEAEKNADYKSWIVSCWIGAGEPRITSRYYACMVRAWWKRPASHYRTDGVSLSATGKRHEHPSYMDGDNVLKNLDIYVAIRAVPDDRYCILKVYQAEWAEVAQVSWFFAER